MLPLCLMLSIIPLIYAEDLSDTPTRRIINGEKADILDFPFMASIQYLHLHVCGGSIISSKFILTSAHCAYRDIHDPFPVYKLRVLIGNTKWNRGIKYGIKKFIVHDRFDEAKALNDIAMIRLDKTPIEFSDRIQPIKISGVHNDDQSNEVEALILGWGFRNKGDEVINKTSRVIRVAEVHSLPLQRCRKFYSGITKDHICVFGDRHKSTCEGDSGGPLVVELKSDYIQIGIVSFGGKFCISDIPEVHTRVSEYHQWIRNQMDRDNIKAKRKGSRMFSYHERAKWKKKKRRGKG